MHFLLQEVSVGCRVELTEAQALIVATLRECGISSVLICADPAYNKYTKTAANGGGGVFYRFESLAELNEEMKPAPKIVQARMFED